MDYDDDDMEIRRSYAAADPLPPDDWAGFGGSARVEALYAEHQPQLARFFRRRAHAQDIADLVQEVFRRFVTSRNPLHAPVEQPRAYLFSAARNLLAEQARRDDRRLASAHGEYDDAATAGADPHVALEARDEIRRVESAIAKLKPKTRDIFLMHRFEGLSYDAIAAARGMSVKGVEKQIAKALVAVRRARAGRA